MKITVVPLSGETIVFEDAIEFNPDERGYLRIEKVDGGEVWYKNAEIEFFSVEPDEWDFDEGDGFVDDASEE